MTRKRRNSFTEPRKVLFPTFKTLDQIFGAIAQRQCYAPPPDLWFGSDGSAKIGPYCAVGGRDVAHHSLYVRARAEVVEAIKANTVYGGRRDTMHFEIVVREKDALVTCSHGIFIGSVWLAKVPLSEVRRYLPEEE